MATYDNYDLFQATDQHLTRSRFHTESSRHFYPSEASVVLFDEHGDRVVKGGCLRASYFRLSGEFERAPYDARSEFIFLQGKAVETMLIDLWKEMGIWHDNNVKFLDSENNISGELDAILVEPSGQLYGTEVKSFYGYYAEKEILGNKSQKGFPKMSQLLQTLIYLNHFEDRLPYFRMVYFARDSVKRRTFKIELLHEGDIKYPIVEGEVIRQFSVNDILDRYRQLRQYLDMHQVPPNDYELQYPNAKIEDFYRKGKIAKTKYEKWKTGKLKSYEHIGDWMCFHPDTLVRKANGKFSPISEIKIGDKVISLQGPTPVIRIGKKANTKPMIKVKPIGMLDSTCTEDHKWMLATWDKRTQFYERKPFRTQMIEAKDIPTSDSESYAAIMIPVHEPYLASSNISTDMAKLLGYYAAEGNLGNWQNNRYYQVHFTLHENEIDLAEEIIYLGTKLFNCNYQNKVDTDPRDPTRHSRTVKFFSVKMADFMRSHIPGQKAIYKRLSSSIMGMPRSSIHAFLNTAEKGDGHLELSQNCQVLSTSSRQLCLQYQQLYWRIGIPAIAQYANKGGIKEFGDGKFYECHQGYRVQYQGDAHSIQLIPYNGNMFALARVRSILEAEPSPEVFDIEVEDSSHVFATETGLASNCSYCSYCQHCWPDL